MVPIGQYEWHKTPNNANLEVGVLLTFNWAQINQIPGISIASCAYDLQLNGVASNDLELSGVANTTTQTQVVVTDAGNAVIGNTYRLVCSATFNNVPATVLVASLDIFVAN